MRILTDALARVRARRSGTTTKRRYPISTLTGLTAAAVAIVVGATGGTMALWVGSASTAASTIKSGDIGVRLGGFNLLSHTFDVNSMSRTGYLTITNSGNVTANFTAGVSLDAGSSSTLANAASVVMWLAGRPADCTAAATPVSIVANGSWAAVATGSQVFSLGAAQSYVLCVRNSVRPSALTGAMSITPRLKVTTSIGGWSESASLAATLSTSATNAWSPYATRVKADGATKYWPLGEAAGTSTVYDWVGTDDATASAGVTRGTAGAIGGSPVGTASTFSGDATGFAATRTAAPGPATFAVEAWIRTTSTTGGKIVGFGNANTGTSTAYDRQLYLDGNGILSFGVYPDPGIESVLSTRYPLNDGAWHYVVGNLSAAGQQLWVDGQLVAESANTAAQSYSGYWRIGGDSPWAGDAWFDGDIDDVAVYPTALGSTAIDSRWTTSGRAAVRTYADRVQADGPALYWRMAGTDPSAYDTMTGTYTGVYHGITTRGVQGAILNSVDAATGFDGATSRLVGTTLYANPQTYTLELWFKADPSATTGGKLIGFGDSATGADSTRFDRQVVLRDDGRLEYGIYSGGVQTLPSPASYRDGQWHYLVVTQSSAGAVMYVDGVEVAASTAMVAPEDYSGYWRVGSDSTWAGTSNPYFMGVIDEVAVYPTALSAAQVVDHWAGRKTS